jgi:hypothetical protein
LESAGAPAAAAAIFIESSIFVTSLSFFVAPQSSQSLPAILFLL